MPKVMKTIKSITINADKCNGCRACEVICSLFHASPRYSSNNPARSRIRIVREPLRDIYLPVYAGEYTPAECTGRNTYIVDGKKYDECDFCRASCPSRDLFKEPDSGLPLKCDMCEDEPPLAQPLCVTACLPGCLTFQVRPADPPADEAVEQQALAKALESLAGQHGIEALLERSIALPDPSEEACRRHHAAHEATYRTGERVRVRHILFAVTPGVDVVAFSIPGTGIHTIAPITALPTITDPINGAGRVVIDGNALPQAPRWTFNATARYGVPFAFNPHFPINTLTLMRGATARHKRSRPHRAPRCGCCCRSRR